MYFPDGGKAVMKPGMAALIEGGSFYRLENTGTGPMVMMGTRTGPNSANKHINYESGEDYLALRGKRGERVNGFIMASEKAAAGSDTKA
jgi:hypothetical protein